MRRMHSLASVASMIVINVVVLRPARLVLRWVTAYADKPHRYLTSDVKSRDSVLSQDSLETHIGCLGLRLDVVVLSIS